MSSEHELEDRDAPIGRVLQALLGSARKNAAPFWHSAAAPCRGRSAPSGTAFRISRKGLLPEAEMYDEPPCRFARAMRTPASKAGSHDKPPRRLTHTTRTPAPKADSHDASARAMIIERHARIPARRLAVEGRPARHRAGIITNKRSHYNPAAISENVCKPSSKPENNFYF